MKISVAQRALIVALAFVAICSCQKVLAQSTSQNVPREWQTHAEETQYRETPRYDETLAYARRLAAASSLIHLQSFGQSGQGRELPLIIAATNKTFTAQAARKSNKAVVLVQACIHAGESDGKDAGLALLRDIVITKTRLSLLDHVVLLFILIYNTDGHERFSPYNRINQNGPVAIGWRATATNLNLNRDYMKVDAPETRAWLKLWNEWNPDLFIDCHVTDGADYRYNITYQYEHHENVPASVLAWEQDAFDKRIIPATEAAGNLLAPYLEFRDNRDLTKGINGFLPTPRYSTAYTPLRNRPGLLIETHMLKDYRTRVQGTYDLLRFTLEEINRDSSSLMNAVRQADEQTIAQGQQYDPARTIPLLLELTNKSSAFQFKGVEYKKELSDVSGTMRVIFGTKPLDLTVPFYDETRTSVAVAAPLYYIVPSQWTDVIAVLRAHGLNLQQLTEEATLDVESYRFADVHFAAMSFEGRVMPTYKTSIVRERRTFPAGSIVIPMSQAAAMVAVHLLEPNAPDSLAAWGFFNAVFEQKEFGESYVLEKLARDMMSKDENLRREFERHVANDPKFAASARERLQFFYDRSPYHDNELNSYPVARILSKLDARVTSLSR